MIGVKQLLIILVGATMFVLGLWYFTRESKDDIDVNNSQETTSFRELNNRIVEFGTTEYSEDDLSEIKADITAAEMADQLDANETKSLNRNLSNSLVKSLNLSFKNLYNAHCFETEKYRHIVGLLENQNTNNKEALDNIQKYYNVKKFKALESTLDVWMQSEYSVSFEDQMERLFTLSGVSECDDCGRLKVRLKSSLSNLKKMDLRYKDQLRTGRYRCAAFEQDSYYYRELQKEAHCPN
ncbi:MAG: hypothetical protein DCO96_03760 [Fluviicola sp. XM-24bin1]|nr:MAG: hypothetical protein DCO96_03760 [Fluviicola sp. XM-24bin1]